MIVWLASYPRSGNTYLRVILKQLFKTGTYSLYEEVMPAFVGHLEPCPPVQEMRQSDEAFFVKTHELPSDDSPAIYLVRDGRDALTSYAHYVLDWEREEEAGPASHEAFLTTLRDLIQYNASFSGWSRNVLAWTRRKAPTVMIHFEDLVQSDQPAELIRDALHRLALPIPSAGESTAPSFAEMQEKGVRFFRRGKIGGWRSEMTVELHELFWRYHAEASHVHGYHEVDAQATLPRPPETILEAQAQLEAKEAVIRELDQALKDLNGALAERVSVIEQQAREISSMRESETVRALECQQYREQLERMTEEASHLEARVRQMTEDLEAKEAVIQSLDADVKAKEVSLASQAEKVEGQLLQLKAVETKLEEADRQLTRASKNLEGKDAEISSLRKAIEEVRETIVSRSHTFDRELANRQDELRMKEQVIDQLTDKLNGAESALAKEVAKLKEVVDDLDSWKRRVRAICDSRLLRIVWGLRIARRPDWLNTMERGHEPSDRGRTEC